MDFRRSRGEEEEEKDGEMNESGTTKRNRGRHEAGTKENKQKKEKSGAALESAGDRLFDLSSFIIPAWGQIMQS